MTLRKTHNKAAKHIHYTLRTKHTTYTDVIHTERHTDMHTPIKYRMGEVR